jgi:hypothetical protein
MRMYLVCLKGGERSERPVIWVDGHGDGRSGRIATTGSGTTARARWMKLVDRRWGGRVAMQAMLCRCFHLEQESPPIAT